MTVGHAFGGGCGHIKAFGISLFAYQRKFYTEACWADMPYICWGEHLFLEKYCIVAFNEQGMLMQSPIHAHTCTIDSYSYHIGTLEECMVMLCSSKANVIKYSKQVCLMSQSWDNVANMYA